MTAILAPPLVFQGIGNGGIPLPGGNLFSYVAGTSTPQATYTDSTQVTPNSNPVILNANGQAAVWLDPTKTYKFILQDFLGNQIYVTDQVQGYLTASSLSTILTQQFLGGIIYPQTQAEAAAGVTPSFFIYPPQDVRRYGADPLGNVSNATATTAAIQTAINVCKFASGANARFVQFNDGTYAINSTLNVAGSFGTDGILLQGNRARINFSHNGACFNFNETDGTTSAPQLRLNAYIRGIDINGPGVASTSSHGIDIVGTANVTANVYGYDMLIQNCFVGLNISAALSLYFDKMTLQFNQIGINAVAATTGVGSVSPNNINFQRSTIISNVQAIVGTNFPNGCMNFIECDIEGNNPSGSLGDGTSICAFNQAGEVNFNGTHFESNLGTNGVYFSGNDSSKTITFTSCENITTCTNVVNIANGYGVFIGGRCFNASATNPIYLSSATSYCLIQGTSTNVAGTVANALWASQSGFTVGTAGQGAAGAAFRTITPVSGIATRFDGDSITMDFRNTAGSQINTFTSTNGAEAAFNTLQAFGWSFSVNSTNRLFVGRAGAATIEPGSDNTTLCGSGSLAWSGGNTHAAFTVISDERTKEQIGLIDRKVIEAWGDVQFIRYKRKSDIDGPWHHGVIAQRVIEVFERHGIDAISCGIVHFNSDRYSVNYEEALVLECAYLRSKLQLCGQS